MSVYNFFSICSAVSTKLYYNTVEANLPPSLRHLSLVLTSSHPIGHSEIHTLWALHDVFWPTKPVNPLVTTALTRLRRLKIIEYLLIFGQFTSGTDLKRLSSISFSASFQFFLSVLHLCTHDVVLNRLHSFIYTVATTALQKSIIFFSLKHREWTKIKF